MTWSLKFADPIILPSGKKLTTLREAGERISKIPKAGHAAKEWQTAMHCLIQAADHGGPVDFAQRGMLQALYRREVKIYGATQGSPVE